jgi:iron-sulfur cluster assembly accessory protein
MAVATMPEQTGTCGTKPAAAPITLTERAASEVKRVIADTQAEGNPEPLYLRLTVKGGGCSGFQNKLDLDPTYTEKTDHLFEIEGVSVVVDKRSMLYLVGATVDFIDDLNHRGFKISNPQAKGSCGCGSSFSM